MTFVNAPVHDTLIRIKNAYMARNSSVPWVVYSDFKTKVLDLLVIYKFIASYDVVEDWSKKIITIHLFWIDDLNERIPVIKFFSKPSRRYYVWYKEIKTVAGGRWIWIMSTNEWVLPAHIAKSRKIWWELIAEIY